MKKHNYCFYFYFKFSKNSPSWNRHCFLPILFSDFPIWVFHKFSPNFKIHNFQKKKNLRRCFFQPDSQASVLRAIRRALDKFHSILPLLSTVATVNTRELALFWTWESESQFLRFLHPSLGRCFVVRRAEKIRVCKRSLFTFYSSKPRPDCFKNRQTKKTASPHFQFLYFLQKIHALQNKQVEWKKRFEMRDQTKEHACSAAVL